MARLKKMFVISDEDYKYLKKIKEENKLQYISDSLKFIIDKSRNGESEPIKSIDKNVKILVEMMNGMFSKELYKEIVTLDEYETPGYKIALNAVENKSS